MSTIDVTKLVRDVQESTMQQAFYLQSKAFFEKNNEHINEIARLKAEVERLTKAATEVDATWSVYENGLIETPEWVKRSQVRDAVSRLWLAAKEGNAK